MDASTAKVGYLTWADRLLRPGEGLTALILRSIGLGLLALTLAFIPLYFGGISHLISSNIILVSAVGVSWVSFFTFFISLHKRLLVEASESFIWQDETERRAFVQNYVSHINNSLRSVGFSVAAWVFFMSFVFLRSFGPHQLSHLGLDVQGGIVLEQREQLFFLTAIGVVTLIAGPLAVTGARFLHGYSIYLAGMKRAKFDSPMASLRDHLTKLIALTGWTGFAYSTGIAVFLIAVGLNATNPIVAFIVVMILIAVIYPYASVTRLAQHIYREKFEILHARVPVVGASGDRRLLDELASEAMVRLSRPIIDLPQALRSVLSIAAPILIVTVRSLEAWPLIWSMIRK